MAKAASPAEHEAAGRRLAADELCLDLAREHTDAIQQKEKRNESREHYEEIALRFYRLRPRKSPSLMPLVRQTKAVEQFLKSRKEQGRLEADLWAVFHDPHFSLERRRAARQELEEFRKEWEEREQQQFLELIEVNLPSDHHPSLLHRLILRFQRVGRDRFFDRFDCAIRRYLAAREKDECCAASMPLLHLLALEWLRDRSTLWRFLEACIGRWEEVTASKGDHSLDLILHNVHELCPEVKTIELAAHLRDKGLVAGSGSTLENLDARLRQRASRNIKKARASGIRIGVTKS